jgi:hypothetical protein
MTSPTFRLIMRQGPTPGQVFELGKPEHVIGRDITNDIVINDSEVSRKHARLVLEAGRYIIEDFGSTNGTFVDGQRLMGPYVLNGGETIMFGENVSLSYEATHPDLEATMVGSPGQEIVPPPATIRQDLVAPEPVFTPPSVEAEQPVPEYSGQVPPGPEEILPPVEEPKKKKTWIIAACGCLLVAACIIVAAVAAYYAYTNYF